MIIIISSIKEKTRERGHKLTSLTRLVDQKCVTVML